MINLNPLNKPWRFDENYHIIDCEGKTIALIGIPNRDIKKAQMIGGLIEKLPQLLERLYEQEEQRTFKN